MSDFETPELPDIDLPDIDTTLAGGGFEGDFAKVMQQANATVPQRDIPPLHPKKTIITDEEMKAAWNDKQGTQSNQLFAPSGKKFRCECGIFNLGDEGERTEYQNMINNCLQKGWVLARDDWTRTQDGGAIAAVKCLVPIGMKKKQKKDPDEKKPEQS